MFSRGLRMQVSNCHKNEIPLKKKTLLHWWLQERKAAVGSLISTEYCFFAGVSTRTTWACLQKWWLVIRLMQTQPPKVVPSWRTSLLCEQQWWSITLAGFPGGIEGRWRWVELVYRMALWMVTLFCSWETKIFQPNIYTFVFVRVGETNNCCLKITLESRLCPV